MQQGFLSKGVASGAQRCRAPGGGVHRRQQVMGGRCVSRREAYGRGRDMVSRGTFPSSFPGPVVTASSGSVVAWIARSPSLELGEPQKNMGVHIHVDR
jgi:hypothetical protein